MQHNNNKNHKCLIISFSIHQFPIPEGKSGQQAAELLQKRLETLGATKNGTFCVECETYYAAPHISKLITCFALLF